jgi:hypothetical protein
VRRERHQELGVLHEVPGGNEAGADTVLRGVAEAPRRKRIVEERDDGAGERGRVRRVVEQKARLARPGPGCPDAARDDGSLPQRLAHRRPNPSARLCCTTIGAALQRVTIAAFSSTSPVGRHASVGSRPEREIDANVDVTRSILPVPPSGAGREVRAVTSSPSGLAPVAAARAAAVTGVAIAGGIGSATASDWYRDLDKPPWQPPGAVFGPCGRFCTC